MNNEYKIYDKKTTDAFHNAVGKIITKVKIDELDEITFTLSNNIKLHIYTSQGGIGICSSIDKEQA